MSIFYWLEIDSSLFTHLEIHCKVFLDIVLQSIQNIKKLNKETTVMMELLQMVYTSSVVTQLSENRTVLIDMCAI